MLVFLLSILPEENSSLSVESEYSCCAFNQHLAHRQPRVLGFMVNEAVAVKKYADAVPKLTKNRSGVFSGDHRIEPPQFGINAAHLAKQKPEGATKHSLVYPSSSATTRAPGNPPVQ